MIREKNVGYHTHDLKTFLLHPNLTLLDKNASYPTKVRGVRNTKTPTVHNARQPTWTGRFSPTIVTSAQAQVHSSTQVEMLALPLPRLELLGLIRQQKLSELPQLLHLPRMLSSPAYPRYSLSRPEFPSTEPPLQCPICYLGGHNARPSHTVSGICNQEIEAPAHLC